MRIFTTLLFFTIAKITVAQPGLDTSTYAFPIGSHFILQIIEVQNELKYTVLKLDTMFRDLDYSNQDSLFEKIPTTNTIEFFFGKGNDQDGPFKTVLLIRNNTKFFLEYKALISYEYHEGFYETSVVDLFPGVKSSELWNANLNAIVLHKFKKKKK
jgi:hypothetical protein